MQLPAYTGALAVPPSQLPQTVLLIMPTLHSGQPCHSTCAADMVAHTNRQHWMEASVPREGPLWSLPSRQRAFRPAQGFGHRANPGDPGKENHTAWHFDLGLTGQCWGLLDPVRSPCEPQVMGGRCPSHSCTGWGQELCWSMMGKSLAPLPGGTCQAHPRYHASRSYKLLQRRLSVFSVCGWGN